jgi:hypothetical protein
MGRDQKTKIGRFLIACLSLVATAARGEVDVHINIGVRPPPPPPPVIVVEAPPTMLYLPGPAVYVAVGVPYDVYFDGDRYYYCHGGHWFWSRRHAGPWAYVGDSHLPPGLRKFKLRKLHWYRDREYHAYRERGPRYHGRHFVAGAPGGRIREASVQHADRGPGKHGREHGGRGRHR